MSREADEENVQGGCGREFREAVGKNAQKGLGRDYHCLLRGWERMSRETMGKTREAVGKDVQGGCGCEWSGRLRERMVREAVGEDG